MWVFNTWGLADLLNAVGRGLLYTPDGALGAIFWIPALIVPLLVVSHVHIYTRLWTEHRARIADANRAAPPAHTGAN